MAEQAAQGEGQQATSSRAATAKPDFSRMQLKLLRRLFPMRVPAVKPAALLHVSARM